MVEFRIPIYGGVVRVFNNRDEYAEHFLEVEDDDADVSDCKGITHQIVLDEEDMLYMIGVFDGSVGTLIHECGHVAVYVAQYTGWVIGESTSEPFCYLLEELYQLSKPVLN